MYTFSSTDGRSKTSPYKKARNTQAKVKDAKTRNEGKTELFVHKGVSRTHEHMSIETKVLIIKLP